MDALHTAHFVGVTDTGEGRGQSIDRRAKALGIFSDREFERMTARVGRRVPRASIRKAIDGDASEATYARIEGALDLLEEETSDERDAPDQGGDSNGGSGTIRFSLSNVYGIGEVVAEGSPEDREAIVESLAKLIRDIREGNGNDSGTTRE